MGNWDQTLRTTKLFMLAIAFIFASCNSYKKTSFYPMVNSVDPMKSSFQFKSIHKSAYQKNLKNDHTAIDLLSTSHSTSVKMGNDSTITRLQDFPLVNSLKFSNNRSSMSLNNRETLTASLTTEPIISRYTSIPDTSKTLDSLTIDSTRIKTTQNQPAIAYDTADNSAKKIKQRETFANVSLIAAIASIVTLFVIPVLFFPAAIAAIVFGALGLKSSKRKRARNSMFIGIIMIVLLTLFVLAYAGVFS